MSINNLKIKTNKAQGQWKSSKIEAHISTLKYRRAKINALTTRSSENTKDKFKQSLGDSRQVNKLINDVRGINNKSFPREIVPARKDSTILT